VDSQWTAQVKRHHFKIRRIHALITTERERGS
jgi:hypothetical protein